jgi:hypothetical protein
MVSPYRERGVANSMSEFQVMEPAICAGEKSELLLA